MDQKNSYLLAIESAIAGGSIALLSDTELIASCCGNGTVSRAEDLLPNIVSMLEDAGIPKCQLSRVAVSLGPGSYTGLRIGIATVMGLKKGLGIEYVGVPLFEALSAEYPDSIVAVPMGKSDICAHRTGSANEPRVVDQDSFAEMVRTSGDRRILIHPALLDRLNGVPNIETLDPNLASYVGLAALTVPPSDRLDPIYVQNPRFG